MEEKKNNENQEQMYTTYAIDKVQEETSKVNRSKNIRQLWCFFVGWIGLSLIATIFSLIISLACTLLNIPLEEGSTSLIYANGIVNTLSYLSLIIALFFILGAPNFLNLFKDKNYGKKIARGLLYGVALIVIPSVYSTIISVMFPSLSDNANQTSVVEMITTMPFTSFLMVVVLGPICEEITYRYGLFGTLRRKSIPLAFFLTSVLFGLIHSSFISSEVLTLTKEGALNELLNLPGYMLSGAILCYAYYKEDSLISSLSAHVLNNFLSYMIILAQTLIS
jgi:hypothetical protein